MSEGNTITTMQTALQTEHMTQISSEGKMMWASYLMKLEQQHRNLKKPQLLKWGTASSSKRGQRYRVANLPETSSDGNLHEVTP